MEVSLPTGRGRKPTTATEKQKGRANEPNSMRSLHLLHPLHLCFDCRGQLRISGNIPQPPRNLIIVSITTRSIKDGQVVLHGQATNMYFHTNERCVRLHILCLPS